MNFKRCLTAMGAGLMLIMGLALIPGTLSADEWNRMTSFSMNQQFEVPGAILEPNTKYVIQVMDSPSARQVVQISNEARSHVITTFMAVSDPRLRPAEDTRFEFMESSVGHPVPIKSWFYPGHLTGLEFLYPKDQMQRIAGYTQPAEKIEQFASLTTTEVTEQPADVLPTEVSEETATAELVAPATRTDSSVAEEAAFTEPEPILATENESENESEPALVAQNTAPTNIELPRTAGNTPFVGLIGVLSLAIGLGTRLFSRAS